MNQHPSEIAKELKLFPFFKSFNEDLILRVATLVKEEFIKAGDYILKEGEPNHCLYFLRSGKAEVILTGEVVALLQNYGEVIGEMSVITQKVVGSSIKALTDVELYKIDTQEFTRVPPKEKEKFEVLLFKIYSNILADRLTKTNERVRFYELTNRELHQAQVTLNISGNKKILLVEADRKQLQLAKMAVGGSGLTLDTANDSSAAQNLIDNNEYDLVLCDENNFEIIRWIKQNKPSLKVVFLANKEIKANLSILRENNFIDYLITRDPNDKAYTIKAILTALNKILSKDLFGLEKYLSWGTDIQHKSAVSSRDRTQLKEEMAQYFQKIGIRQSILTKVYTVAEELLMNAIYDAPTDISGKPLYNHMSRQQDVYLEKHQQPQLYYGCDGAILGISVCDPFGRLTKNIIYNYLESCYNGQAGMYNAEKGGAGRGLHQIIENSDITIFNVKKNIKTEVICLFGVESSKVETIPTFHLFFSE